MLDKPPPRQLNDPCRIHRLALALYKMFTHYPPFLLDSFPYNLKNETKSSYTSRFPLVNKNLTRTISCYPIVMFTK